MLVSFTISPVLYVLLSHAVGNSFVQSSNPGLVNKLIPGSGSGSTVPPPSPLATTFTFLISQVPAAAVVLIYLNANLIVFPA